MAPQSLILLEVPAGRNRKGASWKSGKSGRRRKRRPSQKMSAAQSQGPKRIAIVEDKPELLSAYGSVLRGMGWPTVFAGAKGEDLLDAVKSGTVEPDVVIMDYRLPGMDGLEAARRLHRILPRARVVLTTADDSIREEAEGAGLRFLQKPFSIADLIRYLSRV